MANALIFNIGANTAAFSSGIKKAAAALIGIGAAFLAVKKMATDFQAAIDMGSRLHELARQTGGTAGEMMILQRAFQNAGAGAESVGPMFGRLNKFMDDAASGSKKQTESMDRLGLSMDDLKGKTPTEQLKLLAESVAGIEDPGERAALAMQIFGRSGAEMIPLLRAMGSELQNATRQLGSAPDIATKTAEMFNTLGNNIKAVQEKSKEFAFGLLSQLLPGLVSLSDKLATIDAAGIGEAFSNYARRALEWADSIFKVGEALDQVQQGFNAIVSGDIGGGLNLIWLTMRDTALNAVNQISAAGMAALQAVGGSLSSMFSPESAMMHLMKSAFGMVGSFLQEKLYMALSEFMAAIGRNGVAEQFKYQAETAKKSFDMALFGIGAQVELVGDEAMDIAKKVPAEFSKNYEANIGKPLIEMTDKMAETAAAAKEIEDNLAAAADNMEKTAESAEKAASAMPDGFTPSGRATGEQHGPPPLETAGGGGGGGGSRTQGTGGDMRQFDRNNRRLTEQISELEGRGAFGSADTLRDTLNRRREKDIDRQAERDVTQGRDKGAMARDAAREDKRGGSILEKRERAEKELQDKIKQARDKITGEVDEAMTDSERASSGGGAGGKGEGESINSIVEKIRSFVDSIDKKLPQHALA